MIIKKIDEILKNAHNGTTLVVSGGLLKKYDIVNWVTKIQE